MLQATFGYLASTGFLETSVVTDLSAGNTASNRCIHGTADPDSIHFSFLGAN